MLTADALKRNDLFLDYLKGQMTQEEWLEADNDLDDEQRDTAKAQMAPGVETLPFRDAQDRAMRVMWYDLRAVDRPRAKETLFIDPRRLLPGCRFVSPGA